MRLAMALFIALLMTSTIAPHRAHADERSTVASRPRRWYGWQSIIATAATYALVPVMFAADQKSLIPILTFPLALSSAMPHFFSFAGNTPNENNWRDWRPFIGTGLRVGSAALGALFGAAIANISPHDPASSPTGDGALIGLGVGSFIGATIDIAVLMWRPLRPSEAHASASATDATTRWAIVPALTANSAGLAVAGVF
jgi:hypothetical protein